MTEIKTETITVDDFNVICRVCLQIKDNMINIYESGIENQFMEVTNLKMKVDDELPKSLCQRCSHQVNQFIIFLQQAKSSDIYLRSLLTECRTSAADEKLEASHVKKITKTSRTKILNKWKKQSKIFKKVKNDSESDNTYLIFVPDVDKAHSEEDNQIYIKDLNSGSDNLGLTNYCKTLIKSHISDHTYPKELSNHLETKDEQCESFLNESNCYLKLNSEKSKIYTVNLFTLKCSECDEAFEEMYDLIRHFITHEIQPSILKSNFSCPVCAFSVEEKINFMTHLEDHKKEGLLFVKVNPAGEIMSLKECEKDFFIQSMSQHTNTCKIISVNLSYIHCTICNSDIESKNVILKHLESCLSKDEAEIKFSIRFLCPMCHKSYFIEENFLEHLGSHKKENCYLIKVKGPGEPVELEKNDQLFVPFEEAVKFLLNQNTVFEVVDVNSCDKCNFKSDTISQLCEHYNSNHPKEVLPEVSFCCPVCNETYFGSNTDEECAVFFEHLYVHKGDGVTFILVKRNGEMADLREKYSDLFTQSSFLWSIVNSFALLLYNYFPKVIVLDSTDSSERYTCDMCQGQFNEKQELILHIKSHEPKKTIQGNMNYICEKCGKKCSGRLSYKKHFLRHSKSLSPNCKKPVCLICNKTFANRSSLSGHVKHHLKEGKGAEFYSSLFGKICEKCGKNFSNNASLTKHKKMHLKEKESCVFKCEICGKDFFRQSSFDRHKLAHINPKYFECHICRLPLSSVSKLQKHKEIHKNGSNTFDCKACKLSFLTKDSLTAHVTHTGHYQDRRPLECNVCHEKFFIGRKFTEHIKTHPKYKMGECALCGKRLSTLQSLMLHMGRHFESNSILCPHCGKKFSEEKNYHRHLLTHEGIKPFSCDIDGCKKSFYTLFELNRHKKYHNNTRDFRCIYCSKSFHEANHLTVHIRTHTGERPYSCPHCNKGFVTRTHCKHHIKLVHQGVGYDLIKTNISKKVKVFETLEVAS